MKANQKLNVYFENYHVVVRFDQLDKKLLPLAKRLEIQGNRFGGVNDFDGVMCVQMNYHQETKDGVPENKIFGYPEKEFLSMQYK
jgi:hypothetical protein